MPVLFVMTNYPAGDILICEDDPDDLNYTKSALLRAGISNKTVDTLDGAEGIQYLETCIGSRHFPLMVLLDLSMPIVDGFELLRWTRSHPETRELPVVVMTNSRREEDKVTVQALGVHEYFLKYVTPEKLAEIYERITKSSRSLRPRTNHRPTFLLVDDRPESSSVLSLVVQRNIKNSSVTEVIDSDDALEILRVYGADAVVVHRAADADGPTVVAKLRSVDGSVPILYVSGSEQRGLAALEAGATRFLHADQWLLAGKTILEMLRRLKRTGV